MKRVKHFLLTSLTIVACFINETTFAVSIDDGVSSGAVVWSLSVPSTSIANTAGAFSLNTTIESTSAITLTVSDTGGLISKSLCGQSNMQWRVEAYVDFPLIEAYQVKVRRSTASASVTGGLSYVTLTDTPTTLFCGIGDVNIPVQYKVSGLNVYGGWGQSNAAIHYKIIGEI